MTSEPSLATCLLCRGAMLTAVSVPIRFKIFIPCRARQVPQVARRLRPVTRSGPGSADLPARNSLRGAEGRCRPGVAFVGAHTPRLRRRRRSAWPVERHQDSPGHPMSGARHAPGYTEICACVRVCGGGALENSCADRRKSDPNVDVGTNSVDRRVPDEVCLVCRLKVSGVVQAASKARPVNPD